MAAVAVVTAPFFAATIIAIRQVVGVSNSDDVVLELVARLAAQVAFSFDSKALFGLAHLSLAYKLSRII